MKIGRPIELPFVSDSGMTIIVERIAGKEVVHPLYNTLAVHPYPKGCKPVRTETAPKYGVTETRTGLSVGWGDTEEDAINHAIGNCEWHGGPESVEKWVARHKRYLGKQGVHIPKVELLPAASVD